MSTLKSATSLGNFTFAESFREAWVEVDLGKIHRNIHLALKISRCKGFFAVVKANAYGHGDVAVSSMALASGAKKLCVATLDEALRLRKVFPNAPILILGAIAAEYIPVAAANCLEVTVFDNYFAQALQSFKGEFLRVHLKIDTGMNRLGLTKQNDILEADTIVNQNKWLIKEGIFSHYHSADSSDVSYAHNQIVRFRALLDNLDLNSYNYVHIANSAGMVLVNQGRAFDYGRLGILMYGINPSHSNTNLECFEPAFSLKAKVVHIKELKAGDSVGYSRGYVVNRVTRIAVLPIGYADGFWRYNEGKRVMINNRAYTIVGRISMDQCMIEVDENVRVGDIATMLGKGVEIAARAIELNTIPYELVCAISNRVPRRYINAPVNFKTEYHD